MRVQPLSLLTAFILPGCLARLGHLAIVGNHSGITIWCLAQQRILERSSVTSTLPCFRGMRKFRVFFLRTFPFSEHGSICMQAPQVTVDWNSGRSQTVIL